MPAGEFTAWFERQRCACPEDGIAARLTAAVLSMPPAAG
jgi:hypothetical protein